MTITQQELNLLLQQINGIGGGGLLSDPTIVGIIQRIQSVLAFIQSLLGEVEAATGATGATGPSGAAGPTGPTGPAGGGGGDCDINTTAAKGSGLVTVLATDINDGTAYDEVFVPISGGSGFGTVLTIANDPGGANAYKVGVRVTLNINTGGVQADTVLDVNSVPGLSGLIGSNNLFQPQNDFGGGPAFAANWHVMLQYCGSDTWVLDGQMTGANII